MGLVMEVGFRDSADGQPSYEIIVCCFIVEFLKRLANNLGADFYLHFSL